MAAGTGQSRRRLELLASLAAVTVVAVGVRLAFAPLIPPLLNPDSEGYVQAGWDLLHGNGLDLGLRRTPGYGIFIAAVFGTLGERLSAIVQTQHALGIVNAALAFMLARAVVGPIGGLIVGVLTALSGPLLLYEHYVMTETLSMTALLVALLMTLRALATGSSRWALAAGVATGVALLCRPALQIIMVVGVGGLLVMFRHLPRRAIITAAAFLLGASVLMIPWMVKNAVMYDAFTLAGTGRHLLFRLIRSDTGFNFARPGGVTTLEPEPMASARRVLMEQAAKHDSSSNYKRFREELGLSEAATNKLQTVLALEAIRGQPAYYIQGSLGIFWQIFEGEPIDIRREGSDLSEVDWDRSIRHLVNPPPPRGNRTAAQVWLGVWDPARWGPLIPALFAFGLAAAVPRREPWVLMIAVTALAPQLLGAAMAGYALRFRYPFDPLIAIVAWYGISSAVTVVATVANKRQPHAQSQPA